MKKLRHTTEKLFRIIRNIQNTAYKLDILNFKIHNIFNAFLLKKADECISLTKTLEVKTRKKEYEIREILKERKNKKKKKFLTSQKDFKFENDQ